MATAGFAHDASAIPDWDQAFSFALRTDLACFCVEDSSPLIAMILRVVLHQPLAFLEAVRLTDGARDFSGLLILKFDDELPFGDDGRLSHAHGLYVMTYQTTTYCANKSLVGLFLSFRRSRTCPTTRDCVCPENILRLRN